MIIEFHKTNDIIRTVSKRGRNDPRRVAYFSRKPTFLFVVVDQELEPTTVVERTFVRDGVDQNEHVGPAHVHFQVARFLHTTTRHNHYHIVST